MNKYAPYQSRLGKKHSHAGMFIVVAVVATAAIVLLILELTGTTHFLRAAKATPGVIPSTSVTSADTASEDKLDSSTQTTENSTPENQKLGDAETAPSPTGAAPLAPSGNFVSQHHPNLDDDPAPSSIESVCNTTPGAKCRIEFTNSDGVTKTLAAQTTDGSGATYWRWDIKEAGFTAGTWKIKVIAELNGQTVTAEDPQNLEVAQ